jgi:hypothetical protein
MMLYITTFDHTLPERTRTPNHEKKMKGELTVLEFLTLENHVRLYAPPLSES